MNPTIAEGLLEELEKSKSNTFRLAVLNMACEILFPESLQVIRKFNNAMIEANHQNKPDSVFTELVEAHIKYLQEFLKNKTYD